MIDFYAVYEGVAARLAPLREELANLMLVRAIPSTEESGTATDAGSVYFVLLKGKADPSNTIGAVVQKANFILRVVVDCPALYGERGASYLTQRVIELLLGYKPPQATAGLQLLEFNTYKSKNWVIEIDLFFPLILKESLEQEYEPGLKLLLYLEENKQEFVRVPNNEI